MKKRNNNKGFTLAELLAVVAIVIALAAVAFIAVQRHQRSMTRLEFDSIAKEVFIAAQNHLTMAESQGYLDESITYGKLDETTADNTDKKVYYLVINSGATDYGEAANLLLPYGAVDGNVLLGSILISYQPSTARVLDVFYSKPSNGTALTLPGTNFSLDEDEYKTLMTKYRDAEDGTSRASARQNYENSGKIIGWYGDGDALPIGERLETPEIVVHNEEKLWIEVKDKNAAKDGACLQLTITGEASGMKKTIVLRSKVGPISDPRVEYVNSNPENIFFKVVLDDITTPGQHFAELKGEDDKVFTPGENVVLEAVAYNNQALSNIAYSGKNTTNSLFAEVQRKTVSGATPNYEYVALIANFRHFENLDNGLSGFDNNKAIKKATTSESTTPEYETITKAEQIQDMVWQNATWNESTSTDSVKPFVERIKALNGNSNDINIYLTGKTTAEDATVNCLYPVSPTYVLTYDGKNHSASAVKVDHAGNAGMFGELKSGCKAENLELIDFDIASTATGDTGNAGALVGTATSAEITNVLARNSIITKNEGGTTTTSEARSDNITAKTNAGGLIGKMNGGSVTKSAAALYVGTRTIKVGGSDVQIQPATAGGLIGTAASGTVSASYSGGHTYSGEPKDGAQKYDDSHKTIYPARYYDANNEAMYNVTASGTAGGLIGSAGETTITNSYSTCSASGATAGGLIGTGTGTITNCYCTGLVHGTTVGAFAGTKSVSIASGKTSYFFEIVNEIRNTEKDKSTGAVVKLTSGYSYMTALPKISDTDTGTAEDLEALDKDAGTYNTFTSGKWADAYPYDSGLTKYYQGMYNLSSVAKLAAGITIEDTDYVSKHYGDWPAPEEFIFN